jgi:uncharacterized damage-inducible protein DinB
MNLQDLRTLLDYHYWARDRILAALEPLNAEQFDRDLGSSFNSIHQTLVHLYSAEWAWYMRWQGESPTAPLPIDRFPDVASVRQAWIEQEAKTRAFVDALGEEGLTRVVEYKNITGVPGAAPYWQMVQHIVNHGSYHRGQLTTMVRQVGAAPPKSMDLIAFYKVSRT